MIKKLSTLSGIEKFRPLAIASQEIEDYDLFEMSLSGTPGYPYSAEGWASSKITYKQLTDNLSGSLEDDRDLRVVTLSAQGTGTVVGDTNITIGMDELHTLNIVAGDGIEISGNAAGSKITITVSIYA
jgi:hypothetical protein